MKRLILLLFLILITVLPVMAQDVTGTTLDILNVRAEPSVGNNTIGQLPIATSVTIQGRDASGAWLFVTANGLSGWVSPRYIDWEVVPLLDLAVVGTTINTPATTTVSQPEIAVSGDALSATTKARLNVRSQPNTSGTVLTTLNFGQTVNVIGRNADGAWVAIDTGAVRGWVSTAYMVLDGMVVDLGVVDNVESSAAVTSPASTNITTSQTPVTTNGRYVITGADPNNSTSYDVEITLHWNTTANMDLRVTGPDGYRIVPGVPPSPTGGYFQQPVGANEDCNTSDGAALEVITWDKGTAPSGLYQIEAEYVNNCFPDQEEKTLFWVSVKNDGPEVEFWVYFTDLGDLFEFEFVRP